MKKKIITSKAPTAEHILSQAVLTNYTHTLDISGYTGKDPLSWEISDTIEDQIHKVIQNISWVLEEIWWTLENITKVQIFLTDDSYYEALNRIYPKYFNFEILPARFAIVVKSLPGSAKIEMDAIARGHYNS